MPADPVPAPRPDTPAAPSRCPICGGEARHRWALRDRYWLQPGEWDLYVCRACGHAFIWPVPDNLDELYEHWYTGPSWEKIRELQSGAGMRFMHQLRLKRIVKYVGLNIRSEILDVGCGQGIFLEEVRRAYGCAIAGCDTSDKGLEDMSPEPRRAIDFRLGDLADVDFPDEHYDMVVALHVLEHIPDPAGFLRQCWTKVKPGGVLVLEQPHFGSAVRRLFGQYWTALEAPYHLHHFTLSSLPIALRDGGLPDPVYLRTVPLFPEMTSEWVMFFRKLLLGKSIFHKLFRIWFWIAMWFTAVPFDLFASLVLTRVRLGGSLMAVIKKDEGGMPATRGETGDG